MPHSSPDPHPIQPTGLTARGAAVVDGAGTDVGATVVAGRAVVVVLFGTSVCLVPAQAVIATDPTRAIVSSWRTRLGRRTRFGRRTTLTDVTAGPAPGPSGAPSGGGA